jgi:uncharacterized protein YrzB (UPF0473 family)
MSCECGKQSCSCEAPQMVYLADENGDHHAFYIADRISVEEERYAFLVSTENSEQYALLKICISENGNETLQNITDEAEWERIEKTLFAG